jgi:predicted site-specific integrase-resolvase
MAMVTVDERLSTSSAARVAGVSDQALRDWMKSGRLAYTRTELGALIDHAELARFLAERNAARRERGRSGPEEGTRC